MSEPTGTMAPRGITQMLARVLTSDTVSATAYDDPFLLEAPKILSYMPRFSADQQNGGDTVYDVYSKQDLYEVEFQLGAVPLFAYAKMTGLPAPVSSGSAPNRYVALELAEMRPPYMELDGRVEYIGEEQNGGDYLFQGYKGKIISVDKIEHKFNGYVDFSAKMQFVKRKSDNKFGKMLQRETAIPLTETPDETAPTVSSAIPASNATGIAKNATISITFSEAIQFIPSQFSLYKATGVVPVTIAPTIVGNVVTLNQTAAEMEFTTDYWFGCKGVKDVAGNVLAAEFLRKFTTAAS